MVDLSTDLKWAGGKVVSVKVKSTIGGNLRLRTATPLTLADGTALNPATGNNSNALMQPYNMPAPIVKDMSKIPATNLEETQLYDIPTVAGEEITLVANGVTGIKPAYANEGTAASSTAIYNLSGQRVADSYHGIVISKGKKYTK